MAIKKIRMKPPGYTDIVHPETSADVVIEDASHRFVTDAEKTTWNSKETTSGAQSKVDAHGNLKNNPHAVTKAQVGLGNVDNTSDINKPVSTATQTALNAKANLASPTFTGTVNGITKTMVGLGNVDNTSDANKPISTAQQAGLNLKADKTALALTDQKVDGHLADMASQNVGKGADIIGLPDPNNLFTATNIGGAMQELFTNVSNGKQAVGTAITDVDNSVVIPTDQTFQQLATAIGQISTGKKWASGTVTSSPSTFTFAVSSGARSRAKISVNGLTFIPSIIMVTSISRSATIYNGNGMVYLGGIWYKTAVQDDNSFYREALPLQVNNTGFVLPASDINTLYNWIAYE